MLRKPAAPQSATTAPSFLTTAEVPLDRRTIQLGQNELGISPSPQAIDAAVAALEGVTRYPIHDPQSLREAIASCHGLRAGNIVCGVGSLELLGLIATAYGGDLAEFVAGQFGFNYFHVQCAAAGASLVLAPEPDMALSVDGLLSAVTDRTRLVFLVNPNNPTGGLARGGEIRRLRDHLPPEVLLVLDGAYAEFVTDPSYEDGFDMVDRGMNVAVLRTFSKAYGLAGLRVGWMYAPEPVRTAVAALKAPNAITAPSLATAETAVLDSAHMLGARDTVIELREQFRAELLELGLAPLPSHTNFVLVECPRNGIFSAANLDQVLRREGIVIRPMTSYGLDDHIRVTIGAPDEMAIFIDSLKKAKRSTKPPLSPS